MPIEIHDSCPSAAKLYARARSDRQKLATVLVLEAYRPGLGPGLAPDLHSYNCNLPGRCAALWCNYA
jgi:hypothetical protein